ncbi:hypothetical protein ACFFJB_02590 [Camelimonas abortus]|uniref:Uncharacterized protein n=1 Tax=Camelimonas abortus TaxID=1017184 RepID=A0ABV7LEA0_9HYPH
MTGMRLREAMLAAGLMAIVAATVSLQLSLAGRMKTGPAPAPHVAAEKR